MRTKVLCLALVLVGLVGCNKSSEEPGPRVLQSSQDFDAALATAKDLSSGLLKKHMQGEALSDAEKKTLVKAYNEYRSMIAYRPTEFLLDMGAGQICVAMENDVEAERHFEQALANIPAPISKNNALHASEANYQLARIFLARNEYQPAFECANLAVRYQPKSAEYLAERAAVFIQMKKIEEAKIDLVAALVFDPKSKRANQLLTLISMEEKEKGTKK